MTDELPSWSLGKHSFWLKDEKDIAPFVEVLASRDRLWRELAIADKASIATRPALLVQLLAMRVVATIAVEGNGKPYKEITKMIWCFMTQFTLSLHQLFQDNTPKEKEAMYVMLHADITQTLWHGVENGSSVFQQQKDAGEV